MVELSVSLNSLPGVLQFNYRVCCLVGGRATGSLHLRGANHGGNTKLV